MISPHAYDRNYVPIPDAPQGSMIDVGQLPGEVRDALRTVREYEGQGAIYPTLLADPVRAWFRHEGRVVRS